jgi:hypothetical protein
METLSGLMAEFDKKTILRKDVRNFGSVRQALIDLSVRFGQLNHLEWFIGGWDSDPRGVGVFSAESYDNNYDPLANSMTYKRKTKSDYSPLVADKPL